jgi:hypothetical protein
MVQIRELLSKLSSTGVEYVIVGGVAASLHGSTLFTDDLDVCCPMTEENMSRLIAALEPLNPVLRDPRKIPLPRRPSLLAQCRTLLLTTDMGKFDVLPEITGIGDYDTVSARAVTMEVDGRPTRVLDIDALITAKKAAGRTKDQLGVIHLEAAKARAEKDAR